MRELRYRLLLLAAFLVGICLAAVHIQCPPFLVRFEFVCNLFPEVPRKIGEALIIAPVLALLVDEAAKTKLLREFSLDVSSHITGHMLPVPLREYLTHYLKMFIVRTRWDITYEIEKWDGQTGYIKLQTISEYDMENYSNHPTDYDYKYAVEESLYPHVGCTEITCVRLGEETYEGKKLADVITVENNYKTFSSTKQLLPHNGPNKPTYTFKAVSVECFRDSAFSPFFGIYPVMNATLTVWYPHEALRVSLELTFDDVKTGTKWMEVTAGDRKGIKWIIKGPMLPGQGFIVRWDAIDSQPPESVNSTTIGPNIPNKVLSGDPS